MSMLCRVRSGWAFAMDLRLLQAAFCRGSILHVLLDAGERLGLLVVGVLPGLGQARFGGRKLRFEGVYRGVDVDRVDLQMTWPGRTTAPSSTSRCCTRPPAFDFTSTLRSAPIVPVSTTLISTLPRDTVSTGSAFGCCLSSLCAPTTMSTTNRMRDVPQPENPPFCHSVTFVTGREVGDAAGHGAGAPARMDYVPPIGAVSGNGARVVTAVLSGRQPGPRLLSFGHSFSQRRVKESTQP